MPRLANDIGNRTKGQSYQSYPAPMSLEVHIDSPPARPAGQHRTGIRLTDAEVRRACDSLPPILSLDEAARISHYRRSTLKRLLSEGRFKASVKRKKPVLFWRDRFIQELMQG